MLAIRDVDVVVGLDLSTTRTGIAAAPVWWNGDAANVVFRSVIGHKPNVHTWDQDRSLEKLATEVVETAAGVVHRLSDFSPWQSGRCVVYIESVPTHGARAIDVLAGFQQLVRRELGLRGIRYEIANQRSARSILMGSMKGMGLGKGELKELVYRTVLSLPGISLRDAKGKNRPGDEADAFVVMNAGMCDIGGHFIADAYGEVCARKKD
jgi:hypothetical protein